MWLDSAVHWQWIENGSPRVGQRRDEDQTLTHIGGETLEAMPGAKEKLGAMIKMATPSFERVCHYGPDRSLFNLGQR